MPHKYIKVPMSHAFLDGLDALINAPDNPHPQADSRPYDDAMIERVLASHKPPHPRFSVEKDQAESDYLSPEALKKASEGSELKLSLEESKALYAYAISVEGELDQYGSTERVTELLFRSSWLEEAHGIQLSETMSHANKLRRLPGKDPQGKEIPGEVVVTSILKATTWKNENKQKTQAEPFVKVSFQQRLVPVGKPNLKIKNLEERPLEIKEPLEHPEVEHKETAAALRDKNARALIDRRLEKARYKFNLRPQGVQVYIEAGLWEEQIMNHARTILANLTVFTLGDLYALIPCLLDSRFRKEFCEKLSNKSLKEYQQAAYWIRLCYLDQPQILAEIEAILVNAESLEREIRRNDPSVLGKALKGCTLAQYQSITERLRSRFNDAPELFQQAFSSISYSTRFINGCKKFALWLGSCCRKPRQIEDPDSQRFNTVGVMKRYGGHLTMNQSLSVRLLEPELHAQKTTTEAFTQQNDLGVQLLPGDQTVRREGILCPR